MSVFDGPTAASSAPTERAWEALLIGPDSVRRQLDAATGCGPACLAMALALEAGPEQQDRLLDQAALAARCREASAPPDTSSHPYQWATSPTALAHVLNSHSGPGRPPRLALQQYHIVHAASPRGPIEEILSWLQPPLRPAGSPSLPSFVLARHGTHWMLAVGAKVGADGLDWLAVADPTLGRLRGITAAGVPALFTPNLVGQHPDWTNRHLAVIPSVLPRQPPPSPPETLHPSNPSADTSTSACGPEPVPPPLIAQPPTLAPALAPREEDRLLDILTTIAHTTVHPIARDWLAPLHYARHIVADNSSASRCAGITCRAWALDAARVPVAELFLRGTPAVMLEFTLIPPDDHVINSLSAPRL